MSNFYLTLCKACLIKQLFFISYFIFCIIILLSASSHKICCEELESCEILGQNTYVALSVCPDPLSHGLKLYLFHYISLSCSHTWCPFFPLSFAVKCQMEIQFFCLLPNRWRQHQDHMIHKVIVA